MAEIPERLGWKTPDERAETIEAAGLWEQRALAAEARIRELELERGAEGTNWFPESFVSQLQAQLAAVQRERDELLQQRDASTPHRNREYGTNPLSDERLSQMCDETRWWKTDDDEIYRVVHELRGKRTQNKTQQLSIIDLQKSNVALSAQLAAVQKENILLRDNAWPQGERPNPCAGYGCSGISVWGDEKSMQAVRDAFHYSAQLAEFREQWQAQLAAVTQLYDGSQDHVEQLAKQLQAVTHSLAQFQSDKPEFGDLSLRDQLRSQLIKQGLEATERLAAVTQERDRLNERIKNQSFSILDYQEEKDAREAFIAESREQQQAQITQLQARNSKLETALFSLRNESSGFLGMADQSTHGITNMRCLQRRIEEADAALIQSTEEPEGADR